MKFSSTVLSVVLLAVIVAVSAAQQPAPQATESSTEIGRITHDNVRARAGTADYNAEVLGLGRGDLIEVVGREGDWVEVRVPGGFAAYVKKASKSGRAFVELKGPGEGLVLVDELQLRPKATRDWPAMGELKQNQHVVVLSEEADGWLRVLAPSDESVFVFHRYLEIPAAGQAELRTQFDAQHVEAQGRLLESGGLTKEAMKSIEKADALEVQLKALDVELDQALAAEASSAVLTRLRKDYLALAANAGDDEIIAASAREKATYVQRREEVATRFEQARERIDSLEGKLEENEKRYRSDLEQFRAEKTNPESDAAADKTGAGSRFLRHGIGRIHKLILTSADREIVFVLRKGAEERYLLISDRYDLSEYVGQEIGVTKWESLDEISPKKLTRVLVTRLEVLD